MSYHVRRPYNSWQLYVDYYIAGAFMWMETDSKIREMTKGRKSLDDFASAFFGVNDGDWNIKTYTFDGIVQGLNNVVPYDWADFLRSRLDGHGPHYKGLEAAGWKLVFKDKPSPTQQDYMKQEQIDSDFIYSLGFSVAKDGKFKEVRWDSPAFRAGAAMGMKLVAVNDREYNKDYLSDAVSSRKPIKLLVKDFDVYRTIIVDYKGGLRYPYLERIKGKPDYLTPILTAR